MRLDRTTISASLVVVIDVRLTAKRYRSHQVRALPGESTIRRAMVDALISGLRLEFVTVDGGLGARERDRSRVGGRAKSSASTAKLFPRAPGMIKCILVQSLVLKHVII